jgi:hypothetical protein
VLLHLSERCRNHRRKLAFTTSSQAPKTRPLLYSEVGIAK